MFIVNKLHTLLHGTRAAPMIGVTLRHGTGALAICSYGAGPSARRVAVDSMAVNLGKIPSRASTRGLVVAEHGIFGVHVHAC